MMKTLRLIILALLSCSLLFVSCKKTKQYTITVTVNDTSMGSATGSGIYDENATATLTAKANTNYKFVKWDDGNTDNPRTVTVTADATYMAVFMFVGEEPTGDGVFVSLSNDSWEAAVFQADDQSMPGKIRLWLYKSADAEYPQLHGWMDINTTGNVSAAMIYMGNENDVDGSGYPNWETAELTTTITSVDLASRTITAVQSGKLRNRSTAEEMLLYITYNNALWAATPEPSKLWLLKQKD